MGIRRAHGRAKRVLPPYGTIAIQPCEVSEAAVTGFEKELSGLVDPGTALEMGLGPASLPLDRGQLDGTALGRQMMDDLGASWEAFLSVPKASLCADLETAQAALLELAERLTRDRGKVERFLLQSLDHIPDGCSHWHATAFRLLRLSNLAPTITPHDLLRLALDPNLVRQFNPFLTQASHGVLGKAVLTWLQLCVLEDKLGRLLHFCELGMEAQLIAELQVSEANPLDWIVSRLLLDLNLTSITLSTFLRSRAPGTSVRGGGPHPDPTRPAPDGQPPHPESGGPGR